MSAQSIPVDLFNPGQVFACIGLLEAASSLVGECRAEFDTSDPAGTRFILACPGDDTPVSAVLEFLEEASVSSLAPAGSPHTTEKWQVPTTSCEAGEPFPFPDPSSPATLPAVLSAAGDALRIDHWGDEKSGRDNVKFWAGAAGYPGVGLLRDALAAAPRPFDATDPFAIALPMSSSFRFDWRRDYIPIDAGFSLNNHSAMSPRGYPLVEVLAAIGLSHARPARVNPREKLAYRYGVLLGPGVPLLLHRAALGGVELPFPRRLFRMNLGWPGKAGQARCITTVFEESP